ncbi:hypothetical protein HJFPF1_07838 [Paramyrothecium foliicola]|nr:hypothetical protein HJFPF1_07838 [Paramyrothecium foliicola]
MASDAKHRPGDGASGDESYPLVGLAEMAIVTDEPSKDWVVAAVTPCPREVSCKASQAQPSYAMPCFEGLINHFAY